MEQQSSSSNYVFRPILEPPELQQQQVQHLVGGGHLQHGGTQQSLQFAGADRLSVSRLIKSHQPVEQIICSLSDHVEKPSWLAHESNFTTRLFNC
jgi:hypothetical protein